MRIAFITNPDGSETAQYAEAAMKAGHVVAGIVVPLTPAPLLRRARERFRDPDAADRKPLVFREGWGGFRRLRSAWGLAAFGIRRRVPIITVWSLTNPFAAAAIRRLKVDLLFTSALSHRVPRDLWRLPRMAAVNIHGGGLPDYAGLSSAFWSVYDRADRAWVTFHELSSRWDTGRVILRRSLPLPPDTAPEVLAEGLIRLASASIPDVIRRCRAGKPSSSRLLKVVLRRHPSHEQVRTIRRRIAAYSSRQGHRPGKHKGL